MRNKLPIFVKRGERFFVEPKDKGSDLTFANTRIAEMLHEKHQMDEALVGLNKEDEPPVSFSVKGKPHYAYDVTDVGGTELRKIHTIQTWNNLPVVLWHKQGRGLHKRYQPQKGVRGLPALMRKATSTVTKQKVITKLIRDGIVKPAMPKNKCQ